MLVSLFSALDFPFGMLVSAFAVSGFEWAVFSLAVRELGCELGRLASIFSALVCPFGTPVVQFCIFPLGWVSRPFGFGTSEFGWVVFSLAVKGLGCE